MFSFSYLFVAFKSLFFFALSLAHFFFISFNKRANQYSCVWMWLFLHQISNVSTSIYIDQNDFKIVFAERFSVGKHTHRVHTHTHTRSPFLSHSHSCAHFHYYWSFTHTQDDSLERFLKIDAHLSISYQNVLNKATTTTTQTAEVKRGARERGYAYDGPSQVGTYTIKWFLTVRRLNNYETQKGWLKHGQIHNKNTAAAATTNIDKRKYNSSHLHPFFFASTISLPLSAFLWSDFTLLFFCCCCSRLFICAHFRCFLSHSLVTLNKSNWIMVTLASVFVCLLCSFFLLSPLVALCAALF